MKSLLPDFERVDQPLLSLADFRRRMARTALVALSLVLVSLAIGMIGYHALERLAWPDAFLDSSMLLGGMGPVHTPVTLAGKLFAGVYAIYCGLVVIAVAGILLGPVAHRMLHRFHVATDDDAGEGDADQQA